METSLIVLGSGQDGGAPQLGHRSSISESRTASSVAVVSASGAVVLLDASPDIRVQSRMLLESPLYPTGRESLVDSVFITHAHMGHYTGLLHFGNEAAATDRVPLFGSRRFVNFMEENEPWATLLTAGNLDPIPIDTTSITIDHTLAVAAITVPHRDEFSDTVAFSVEVDRSPWLLYLPDIDDWQSWDDAESEIARHDIAILDATFSASDELPDRDITSMRHPLVPDTIARFAHLTADTDIVLTHINHSNALGNRTATITRKATDAGFTVAYDGLTLERGRAG
ncbi:MAG: MBL fold metallo-hydrolase [Acidimicrobiia bacterium]